MRQLFTSNFLSVVKEGRRPGLQLQRDGQPVDMKAWAAELLEQIAPLAALLDQSHGGDAHSKAVDEQLAKIRDVSLTPSAKVLASMAEHKKASPNSPCAKAWPTPNTSAASHSALKIRRLSKKKPANRSTTN
jgi:gamma-glutamylcysteine synthetase